MIVVNVNGRWSNKDWDYLLCHVSEMLSSVSTSSWGAQHRATMNAIFLFADVGLFLRSDGDHVSLRCVGFNLIQIVKTVCL